MVSVDYNLVCTTCKAHIHVGQMMAGGRFTAGSGSADERGQQEIGEFLLRHQGMCRPLGFTTLEGVPEGYKDEGSP